MPRSMRACRTVGNARKAPSSGRWVTFAIIAAHISPADNVLRNDNVLRPDPDRRRNQSQDHRLWRLGRFCRRGVSYASTLLAVGPEAQHCNMGQSYSRGSSWSSMLLCLQVVKRKPTGDVASVKQTNDGVPLHDGQWIRF
jgi:hypothetical protein